MARYLTADDIEVEATLLTEDTDGTAAGNWTITFPDGTTRYAAPGPFDADFEPIDVED